MKLPASVTTVTTFSKLLALFLFILFPIVGFYLGMEYEMSKVTNSSDKYYVAKLKDCPLADFTCPSNYEHFSDPKGCGCTLRTDIGTDATNQISDNDITNWKTYTNSELGFEFKYPPTLSQDLKESATFDSGRMFKTVFSSNNLDLQLVIWAAHAKDDLHSGIGLETMKQISVSTIKVGPYQADMEIWETNTADQERYKAGDDVSVFYSVSLKDKPLDIWYMADNKSQISLDDFSRILSTFKFTNPCSNCPAPAAPPPGWCKDGTVVGGEPVFDGKNNCYCPGPLVCQNN